MGPLKGFDADETSTQDHNLTGWDGALEHYVGSSQSDVSGLVLWKATSDGAVCAGFLGMVLTIHTCEMGRGQMWAKGGLELQAVAGRPLQGWVERVVLQRGPQMRQGPSYQ